MSIDSHFFALELGAKNPSGDDERWIAELRLIVVVATIRRVRIVDDGVSKNGRSV
jgi:hypothetical protein